MHSQGNAIHRDSDTIFTDFSSSSRFEIGPTNSTENPARTSAMYGAPELVRNLLDGQFKRHGCGSDIFLLGCVFVEMLILIDGRTVSDFRAFCIAGKEATSHDFSAPNG